MLVKIKVEDRHIDHGVIQECADCPGALAILENVKQDCWVRFGGYDCVDIGFNMKPGINIVLPKDFQAWQEDHANWNADSESYVSSEHLNHKAQLNLRPEPIEFELDIPEEYLKDSIIASNN